MVVNLLSRKHSGEMALTQIFLHGMRSSAGPRSLRSLRVSWKTGKRKAETHLQMKSLTTPTPNLRGETLETSMVVRLEGLVPLHSEAQNSLAHLTPMEIIPEIIGLAHIGLSMVNVVNMDFQVKIHL